MSAEGYFPMSGRAGLSPIAWALLEQDEIGHSVTAASMVGNPCRHIDSGPGMTSREVISFAIEASARASSRFDQGRHKRPKNRT